MPLVQSLVTFFRISFLFFFILSPEDVFIDECKPNLHYLQSGDKCWAWIDDLHPTQFAVGSFELQESIDKLNEMSGNELHREKLRKSVPVNVGPGGNLYMYNKHHTIRALYESTHPDSRKWVYVSIENNWLYHDENGFFRRLMAYGFVRLIDAKGVGPLDPALLPSHIKDLQNDLFRSLAAYAKNNGCWEGGKNIPYIEFIWADFFREKLRKKLEVYQIQKSDNRKWCIVRPYSPECIYSEEETLSKLLPDVLLLCKSNEAKNLPGYISHNGLG